MEHLVFLSYGRGVHVLESRFALLSAELRKRARGNAYQTVVYTDLPDRFSDLGVATQQLDDETLKRWRGPHNFGHRAKVSTIRDALHRFGSKIVFVDSDVYFLRPPAVLFDRVSPGVSLMHLYEGRVGRLSGMGYLKNYLPGRSYQMEGSECYKISVDTAMWNSGVIGVDSSDAYLLDRVIDLCDAIHASSPTFLSEQLAFTLVLHRFTQVNSCRDVVFHYHHPMLRNPHRDRLPVEMERCAGLPIRDQAQALWKVRPLPPVSKKIKAMLKRPAKRFGLFSYDTETSI